MKTFEATFKTDSDGVFAISLVEDPAMESTFIALSKQKVQLKTIDEEQRILMGLVLEPDKLVPRNLDGEDFNIVFKADTIKELSHNFFKSGFQSNSSIEHEGKISGVTFVESWIVEDSKIDKSANFGLSHPKGSWIATMKIDNDEVWNDYVKTGKVKGFSVDAMIDLKEIKLNKYEMNSKSILEKIEDTIKSVFLNEKPKVIKLGSVVSGEATIEFEGDVLEVDGAVWISSEDGERVPLPVRDYPLDDGRVLVVSSEGIVGEIKASAEEELESKNKESAQMEEVVNAIKSIMIKYKSDVDERIDDVEKTLDFLKKENDTLKEEVVELSKQPATKPLRVAPEQLNKAGRILQAINRN